MKRNTLAKKLMAALLTGTMIMSMGMTSFATTGVHDGGTSGVTGVTLTKRLPEQIMSILRMLTSHLMYPMI